MAKPLLHYIWWGPVPSDELASVKDTAERYGRAVNLQLWCSKDYVQDFARVMPIGVNLFPVELGNVHKSLDQSYKKDVSRTIHFLAENRAYSAIKDLLMLHILHSVGGTYLDTTTGILGASRRRTYRADPFDAGIKEISLGNTYLDCRFPDVGMKGVREYYPAATPWPSSSGPQKGFTPSVDYWAAWGSPRGKILGVALSTYINYVKKMPRDALASPRRDSIIGDLITLSVQEGFAAKMAEYDEALGEKATAMIKSQMWPVGVLTDEDYAELGANWVLPCLALCKWHKGTWRRL